MGFEIAAATVLLGAIVVAPWMATPLHEADATRLVVLAGIGIAAWVATVVLASRRPSVPVVPAVIVGALLAWGGLLTVNARQHYDASIHGFVGRSQLVSWLPGAIDPRTAARALVPIAAVLLMTLVFIDLARSARFQLVALWALAANGAALGSLGALARLNVLTLFHHADRLGGTPFLAFGYHGNAAAYLDLVLPAALALLLRALRRQQGQRFPALAVAGILAGCASQASKAGLVAAVAIVLVFAVAMTRHSGGRRAMRSTGVRGGAVVLAVVVAVVAVAGMVGAGSRWAELPDELQTHNGRLEIWKVAIDVWTRDPLVGSGPGSFKLLVPSVAAAKEPQLFSKWVVSNYAPGHPVTIWMYAHDDALQTLAEWGLIGALLFGALLLWPIGLAVRTRRTTSSQDAIRIGGIVALGALYLHSLIDFPLQILSIQLAAGLWAAILLNSGEGVSPPPGTPARCSMEDWCA